ncbi:MAG: aspartyl/asparaginyl beta-hydroxylase domain-containing protein [Xanthomonadales bacterium]|nr:aspartyl/asparaginyl beta-hydroxylase domain-containing protein [Xanthomonadales bacterium]
MKLDTEFIKLPLLFDVERLQHEIAQFSEDEWMSHTTGFTGNLSIPLIALDGEFNDAMHGPMKPTPALARCEYIRQIMTEFGEVFGRSRLMRLEPGSTVPPHVDVNYHWFNRVRLHIPITTNPKVLFYCGDRHLHMAAGEAWIFNTWVEHTVENNSDQTRVHLVLDTSGSTRFWALAEKGEWPFADGRTGAEPRFVPYEPSKPSRIRTETYNAPLVQSPGELAHLVRTLRDEVVCSGEAEEQSRAAFERLWTDFLRDWREVWSEHAMKPSGWPAYRALRARADQEAFSIRPELAIRSGVGLAESFRSLVLATALNEELAAQYLDRDEVPARVKKAVASFLPEPEENVDQVPRNAPCPCGSGERYKHCHGKVA